MNATTARIVSGTMEPKTPVIRCLFEIKVLGRTTENSPDVCSTIRIIARITPGARPTDRVLSAARSEGGVARGEKGAAGEYDGDQGWRLLRIP